MEKTLNLYSFDDYRLFLKTYLNAEENVEAGERKRLLLTTGISSSLLTQILSEKKQMTSEQALEVAYYLRCSEAECDYFLLLVEYGRAGSKNLKDRYLAKIRLRQAESRKVTAKVTTDIVLTDEEKAVYYSSWLYTAVRNATPTSSGKDVKSLSTKLGIPEEKIAKVVEFLLDIGLVAKTDKGLEHRPGYTHLDASHPLVFRHHQNWRQRAIHRMDHYKEPHLHYTLPMAISHEFAKELRGRILETIKVTNESLRFGAPETSYCLNVDFFEY